MEFRVLDEVVEIENKGLLLFVAEEDCRGLCDGCVILDSRGNAHTVERVNCAEELSTLFIRGGSADYFRRLFRDVTVDATLFICSEPEDKR